MPQMMEIESWKGFPLIWIGSAQIDSLLHNSKNDRPIVVGISPQEGFGDKDLNILLSINTENVIGLILEHCGDIDISAISALTMIKYISVSDTKRPIDLSWFPKLEYVNIDWYHGIKFFNGENFVRTLYLDHFKPKDGCLDLLKSFTNVRELRVVQSSIRNLDGIGSLIRLESMLLGYLPNLQDISSIGLLSDTLLELEFEKCGKIANHHEVKSLKKLTKLLFCSCGTMPSIDFINDMKSLKFFTFIGTNVVDGDMSPLLRLDYAAFTNKRHFSHKFIWEDRSIISSRRTG